MADDITTGQLDALRDVAQGAFGDMAASETTGALDVAPTEGVGDVRRVL
ncbi:MULTISPECIES: hypothetical protein [unclassified Agrococcus]